MVVSAQRMGAVFSGVMFMVCPFGVVAFAYTPQCTPGVHPMSTRYTLPYSFTLPRAFTSADLDNPDNSCSSRHVTPRSRATLTASSRSRTTLARSASIPSIRSDSSRTASLAPSASTAHTSTLIHMTPSVQRGVRNRTAKISRPVGSLSDNALRLSEPVGGGATPLPFFI